jgi:hypothetical protein
MTAKAKNTDALEQFLGKSGADNLRASMESAGLGKLGVTKVIARGNYGPILSADDKLAIKITSDANEANSAAILLNDPIDEAYHVYGVWRIGNTSYFALVTELLRAPPAEYRELADAFAAYAEAQDGVPILTEEHAITFAETEGASFSRDALSWLVASAVALEGVGIKFRDPHAGNVMSRFNGEIVWIDLGHLSRGPRQQIAVAHHLEKIADYCSSVAS